MTVEQIPLVGYADRFSARPGETIEFKVSSTSADDYDARLVRVVSCDPNPEGPGIIENEAEASFAGSYPSRPQEAHLGSCMRVAATTAFDALKSVTVIATIWPTTPQNGLQGILTRRGVDSEAGFGLAIDTTGAAACLGSTRLSVDKPMVERRWYRIWMSYDATSQSLSVGQSPLSPQFDADDAGTAEAKVDGMSAGAGNLIVAAFQGSPSDAHYNGKIERPIVVGVALTGKEIAALEGGGEHAETIACWDFSQGIDTPAVTDIGPHGLSGALENLPARAMTSSQWDGSCFVWRDKPAHYAAIHFHDDDIYDCGWDTDFSFTVPDDFKSGVYAARLKNAAGDEDMIPFFVPAAKGRPQARLCVLIPTFTYTVYGNISRGNTLYIADGALAKKAEEWGAWPWNCDEHQEFGLSTYNYHHDGSGICAASRLRPIITMRTATVAYPDVPGSGLRHFAADAHLWYWLEQMGYDFDVITDHELHEEGVEAISAYDAVMTPTHPEYHTNETLDALQGYVNGGGHFLYLGGNGFYWKVALNPAYPAALEIRRGEGGIRMWAAEPGESYNALDGTYGGLWRRNGRPPQQFCGVGFSAQGKHIGDAYRRTEASRDPAVAWIFDGIEGDIIGDFGFSGGGAAGFELDRADAKLGTPRNAVVLASSEGHGEHLALVPEEILITNVLAWNGEPYDDLIRADIVYFDTPNGGAVFSVGSITFCGSLPYNECDNNVSKMTANVLNKFLER